MERPPYEIALQADHIKRLEEEIKQLKKENEHLTEKEEEARHYLQEAEQYKQTLTEIKEIVRQEIVCDDCNFQGTDKCDSRLCTSFYLDDFCKNIFQKISECEVIDER